MRTIWIVPVVTVIAASWLGAGRAEARPTIAIVATRDAPALPGLAAQVELHASGRAAVELHAEPDADPLTFAERASELVASGRAALVVWIAPVDRGFLVFVAGPWTGRALTELVRIDAGLGAAEIERTVALKIAGLVDAIDAIDVSGVSGVSNAPPRTLGDRLARAVPPVVDEPPARRRVEWRLEVDGAVAYEPHQRGPDGRATVAVGRAWARGPWWIAPSLGARWQPSGTIESAAGRASIVELGAVVALDLARELGPLEVMAQPQLVMAGIAARGTADDGRRGHATVFTPYAGMAIGVRYPLSQVVRIGITGGCDLALIRRELLIDGQTVVDFGRARLGVGATLLVSI